MSLCNSYSAFRGNRQTSDNRASSVFPFFVNIVIVTSKNYLQSKALSNLGISLHPLGPVSPQEEAAIFAKPSWCQHGGDDPPRALPLGQPSSSYATRRHLPQPPKSLQIPSAKMTLGDLTQGNTQGGTSCALEWMTPLQHLLNLVSSSSSSLGSARSSIFQLCSCSLAPLPSGYY